MSAYSTAIIADSPVGYWHCNEASGTTLTDSSGNSRNGTISATGVTYSVTGAFANLDDNKALTFDGTSGKLTFADNNVWSMNNTNAFSVELWFKLNNTPGAGKRFFIKGDVTNQFEWYLDWEDGTQDFRFIVESNNDSIIFSTRSAQSKARSTWYHIVGTCSGAPGSTQPKIYINGVDESVVSNSTGGTYTNGTAAMTGACHPAGNNFTSCSLDEIAIYNVALSSTQIANHYNIAAGNITVTAPLATTTNYVGNAPGTPFVPFSVPTATTTNYAGLVPTIAVPTILPPVGIETLVGLTPATPFVPFLAPLGTVSYAGFVPSVNGNASLAVPLGTITVLGLAPTIAITAIAPLGTLTYAAPNPIIHTAIYTTVILQDHPWLYWHLDEASGTSTILDYSGNHYDGTVTGAGTVSLVDGAVLGDNALTFGSGAYVTSPTTNPTVNPLNSRNWSCEFWTQIAPNASSELNFYNTDTVSTQQPRQLGGFDLLIRRDQNTVNISFLSEYPDNTSMIDWPPASVPLTDDWSHWVVTLSVTQTSPQHYNAIGTVYFNGVGVININQNFISSIASFGFPMAGTSSFGVGKFINSPPYYLSGITIDELAVYNYTLTASQVLTHYNAGTGSGASINALVAPSGATVSYAGLAPASVAHTPVTVVQPAPVTINYAAIVPTISTSTGSVTILLNTVNFNLAGLTAQISAAIQNINVVVLPGDLQLSGFAPIILPNFIASAFRFVKNSYTGFTALDADYESTMDAGPLFHSQQKILSFRLANLSPSISYFKVKAFASAELTVEFSLNNVDWFPSIDLKVIKPNAVTDMIYCRITVSALATIGSGNYLIDVDQTYA